MKKSLAFIVTIVSSLVSLTALAAPFESNFTSRPSSFPEVDSTYSLVSKSSSKCLDIKGGSTHSRVQALQWDCNDGDNQSFELLDGGGNTYFLKAVHSGKCLDVSGASSANGAKVQQYRCNQTDGQRVILSPTGGGSYSLTFVHSGKCLDVSSVAIADSTIVRQWECYGASTQQWYFRK